MVMFAYVKLVLFHSGRFKTVLHLILKNLHREVTFGSFVLEVIKECSCTAAGHSSFACWTSYY